MQRIERAGRCSTASRGAAPAAVDRARREAERRRDQRERPRELEQDAARDAVMQRPAISRSRRSAAMRGVDEVEHVVVEDARCFERGAEQRSRRTRRPSRRRRSASSASSRHQAERRRRARRAPARRRARRRSLRATSRPTCPAARGASVVHRETCAVPTPCRSRWRPCRCRPRSAPRRTPAAPVSARTASSARATAAIAATPVLAIALPAPRRPPRSSAMPSSDLAPQPEPRRDRRGDERRRAAAPSRRQPAPT